MFPAFLLDFSFNLPSFTEFSFFFLCVINQCFFLFFIRFIKINNKKKLVGKARTQISRSSQTRNSASSMDVTNRGAGITMDATNPMISSRGSQYVILGHMTPIIAPEIFFCKARADFDKKSIVTAGWFKKTGMNFRLTRIWRIFIVRKLNMYSDKKKRWFP
ncbi:hypothetical protein Dpo_14c00330 [Desulfotignum phosphitoxidans DSM 13687]|uniref:Uncharacterized protein n=1 Tax=Desulfotignum phosphitoxidans DSM 13687 TaxID=1286635 RepID=S0FS62_9BACT|nr:hypothetical protein Dpo_14c00330 [Desulfotignum phosphitoxidans DSM 13687]